MSSEETTAEEKYDGMRRYKIYHGDRLVLDVDAQPLALTAAEHIEALVAMGAKRQVQTTIHIGKPDGQQDILILPPEMLDKT